MSSSFIHYDLLHNIALKNYAVGTTTLTQAAQIWLIKISDHITLLNEAAVILDEGEQIKAGKLRKEEDKNRFIIGRIMLRKLLADILHCQPNDVQIILSAHNKPILDGASAGSLHFSLSHSGEYILIGISNNEIGVDIEHIDRKFEYKNILQQCFTSEESTCINNGGSANFYLLWTRKEALLKATGKGLISKLAEINAMNGRQGTLHEIIDSSKDYLVSSVRFNDSYVASICRETGNDEIILWSWQ